MQYRMRKYVILKKVRDGYNGYFFLFFKSAFPFLAASEAPGRVPTTDLLFLSLLLGKDRSTLEDVGERETDLE